MVDYQVGIQLQTNGAGALRSRVASEGSQRGFSRLIEKMGSAHQLAMCPLASWNWLQPVGVASESFAMFLYRARQTPCAIEAARRERGFFDTVDTRR